MRAMVQIVMMLDQIKQNHFLRDGDRRAFENLVCGSIK